MKKCILGVVLGCIVSAPVLGEHNLPQGGGMVYPAWTASYWRNAKLEGAPAWTQSQVRVRFDWEEWRPVLGTRAESVRDFPADNFSARFSGRFIARFSEEYAFKLVSDEGARLKVRPEGAAEWRTLIDAWQPHKRRADTAKLKLEAGKRHDIEIEHYDLEGEAVCELFWSAPSVPEEVLEYTSGTTVREYWPYMNADMNQQGGGSREDFPANSAKQGDITEVDENGWPKQDFKYVLQQGWATFPGRHLLSFHGQAEIGISGANFVVGEEKFSGTLPKGKGYDAASNQTRAFFDVGPDNLTLTITAKKTQRTPDSPEGSGVTELHVMKPVAEGADRAHEVGEVACGAAREAFLPAMFWRVQRTGLNDIVKWAERTPPGYARITGKMWRGDMAYEKLVLAANELGRDLHLCFGGSIDYEFMDNLAKLTRFGSDGANPYDKPVKNPAYPPLNSNLRLYLEHGNEMGWSAIQPRDWTKDYDRIRASKQEPEWSALNFDGKIADDHHRGVMRYHAYRTVRMSQAMRKVWGDAAMGDKVRVLLFGQYERDFQNTMPQFIDDYFNNGTGNHVKDPRSVSHHLWGAGPAVYYGTVNMWAENDKAYLKDRSFEESELAPGTATLAPKGGAWTFEGGAGVVDVRLPRRLSVEPAAAPGEALAEPAALGYQFTVGPKDLHVYEIGRGMAQGEKGKFTAGIHRVEDGKLGAGVSVSLEAKGKETAPVFEPVRYSAWMTSDSRRVGVLRLEAGKTYVALCEEGKGSKAGTPAPLQAGPGLRIDGPVRLDGELGKKASGAVERVGEAGSGYGRVVFRYTDAVLEPAPGMAIVPPDPAVDPSTEKGGLGKSFLPKEVRTGTRMAFVAGRGALGQKFRITEPGDYALILSGAHGQTGDNPLTITMGGEVVWEKQLLQGSRKPKFGVFNYGTRYVHLEPGEYELRIEGTKDDPKAVVFLDGMHIGSMHDYFGGPNAENFLGAGAATGQTDAGFARVAKLCTAMAQIWGLVAVAYEGGTNAGGDWNGGNVFYCEQAKWEHPFSKIADNNWARFWHRFGGFNAMYYYPGFPDKGIGHAAKYMPWAAAIERAQGWELEPQGGLMAPGEFTTETPHYQGEPASRWDGWHHPFSTKGFNKGARLEKRQWKAWVVQTPEAREYSITVETTAGGQARLALGDARELARGPSGQPVAGKAFLVKGVHSVKVRAEDGAFDIGKVVVR